MRAFSAEGTCPAQGKACAPGVRYGSSPVFIRAVYGKDKPHQAQESVMDFLFFFIGIVSVVCALTYIKKTSPNKHH